MPQHLLVRAPMTPDAVCDDLRYNVVEAFGDRHPVLVVGVIAAPQKSRWRALSVIALLGAPVGVLIGRYLLPRHLAKK